MPHRKPEPQQEAGGGVALQGFLPRVRDQQGNPAIETGCGNRCPPASEPLESILLTVELKFSGEWSVVMGVSMRVNAASGWCHVVSRESGPTCGSGTSRGCNTLSAFFPVMRKNKFPSVETTTTQVGPTR